MSKEDFFCISGKRDLRGLRRSDARLRLYDGSIMKPLGRYTVEVHRGLTKCQLEFEKVHSSQKPSGNGSCYDSQCCRYNAAT